MRIEVGHHIRAAAISCLVAGGLAGCGGNSDNAALIAQGKQTFRFDTFGDETKWTDVLHMDQVVSTVDPTTALKVGLKVDSEALPPRRRSSPLAPPAREARADRPATPAACC